ncbi:GGDEF domain-containing protein [Clostridium oryzae]|uniref:Putative diguanylate cyclase YeaJ n=1 Tax=Clostridium oryzae TaxID=1450648 RepID=A0A1V4IIW2_9CLOT|nr:GGDEF domain-containing protein [Clostridium oryzae]OPJ59645.1 putative diguanylate cyclase YeaJ [Clostridium oryzae]
MNLVLRIDNNVVAIIVSIIFLINISNNLDRKETKNKAFSTIFILNTIELTVETLTCIINRQPYLWLIPITTLLHIVLYILAPIVTYNWYMFTGLWINSNTNAKRKKNLLLLLPIIVNTFLVLLSPFFKLEFYINQHNIYARGPLFFIPAAISYLYLFCGFINIYTNRKKLRKIEFKPMFLFGVFPSLASLVQLLFYGPLLMWSSITFSLIILYLFLQQQMMHVDYLTGAWTREKLYHYLCSRIEQKKQKVFSLVFIDINDFKKINDAFGHGEGDIALVNLVHIMKSQLRQEDIIIRYGGDEFILILNVETEHEAEAIIRRISKAVKENNSSSKKEYELSFSYGYELYNFDKPMTPEEYINHVDRLMYLNKSNKKLDINSK